MSAPQRSDFPNGRSGYSQYVRALREHKEFGTAAPGSKTTHKGAVNDRGINIGDLYQQTRGGIAEYKNVGGVKTGTVGGVEKEFFNREPITLDGTKYFPAKSGSDVIYQQRKDSENPVRPSQAPTPDQEPDLVEEVTAVTADEVRENSNGMVQKGRNMSTLSRGDDNLPYIQGERGLLDRVGLGADATLNSGWASNQLPGTDSSLYGGQPASKQLGEGNQSVVLSNNLAEDGGAVRNLESMPEEAFNATQSGDGRPTLFTDARSRAFLDAPNSMAGKRAVDAQLGRFRAGGDYHYVNPNAGDEGESEFIKVSTDTARQHQNGQITGQQLLAKHMDRVIQDTPSETQFNPDEEIDY